MAADDIDGPACLWSVSLATRWNIFIRRKCAKWMLTKTSSLWFFICTFENTKNARGTQMCCGDFARIWKLCK